MKLPGVGLMVKDIKSCSPPAHAARRPAFFSEAMKRLSSDSGDLWAVMQDYNMAMLSGVQLRCVDVLLPPGDLRPFVAPPSVEPRALGSKITPEPWWLCCRPAIMVSLVTVPNS